MVTQGPITINTTALTWSQVGSSTSYAAGNGINLSGSTLSVVGTANRITVGAGGVDIASNYVGQTSITTLGTISNAQAVWNGTAIAIGYGGTGADDRRWRQDGAGRHREGRGDPHRYRRADVVHGRTQPRHDHTTPPRSSTRATTWSSPTSWSRPTPTR
jgi:hypothetical protein